MSVVSAHDKLTFVFVEDDGDRAFAVIVAEVRHALDILFKFGRDGRLVVGVRPNPKHRYESVTTRKFTLAELLHETYELFVFWWCNGVGKAGMHGRGLDEIWVAHGVHGLEIGWPVVVLTLRGWLSHCSPCSGE